MHTHRSDSARSLVDLLVQRAEARPEARVYRFCRDGQEIQEATLGAVHARAGAIAAGLRDAVPAGSVVWLAFHNDVSFITSLFGCLYAGIIAVPLPLSRLLTQDTTVLQAALADSHAAAIVTCPELLSKVTSRLAAMESPLADRVLTDAACAGANAIHVTRPSADAIAYLQYTSGSIAAPRGVMITHANVIANLAAIDAGFTHDAHSVSVTWLPHFHDMGLVYGLLQPIFSGYTAVVLRPSAFAKTPEAWLRAISDHRATHSGGPNFAYDLCVRRVTPEAREHLDLSSWRVAFNGAEQVQVETMNRFATAFASCGFRRSAFFPAYGLAEATLKVTGGFIDAVRVLDKVAIERLDPGVRSAGQRAVVGCGRTDAGTSLLVVNPDDGEELPPGKVGEIWVTGPSVASGYWNRPLETETTFNARLKGSGTGPYLRTGDLGFVLDDELFITGRLKEVLIIRGQNYYPHDLELLATSSSDALRGQSAAAFVGSGDTESLVLACEVDRHSDTALEEAADSVRAAIASECGLAVDIVCFVKPTSLPKTSSGKLRRLETRRRYEARELPILYESVSVPTDEPVEPIVASDADDLSPAARRVLDILGTTVRRRLTRADLERPLATLGLDSVRAMELMALVETEFGVAIPVSRLLAETTGVDLVRMIATERAPAADVDRSASPRSVEPMLGPEQERLWYAAKLAPDSSAYNLAVAIRVRGPLDGDVWEAAVKHVEARHEPLRTLFTETGGKPSVRLLEPTRGRIVRVFAASGASAEEREAAARDIVEDEAAAPFRLTAERPFRAALIRLDAGDHLATFVIHHIASDVWSFKILLDEVGKRYVELAAHRRDVLASADASALSYAEYVRTARGHVTSAALREDEAYWADKLYGIPADTSLPFRKPASRRGVHRAGTVGFTVAGDRLDALRHCAQSEGVTPFVVLLSVMRALLWSLSGQRDVVLGVPIANRPTAASRSVIGPLAQPAPIRVRLRGEETFSQLLGAVRSTLGEALDHQRLPFAGVVDAIGPSRSTVSRYLFSVMFGFHEAIADALTIPGLEARSSILPRLETDFDLFLDVEAADDEYRATLTYDAQLIDDAAADELIRAYSALVDRLVADPSLPLTELAAPPSVAASSAAPASDRRAPEISAATPFTVVVASAFVAEPLGETIRWWSRELAVPIALEFAPAGQLVQQLLAADGRLRTNRRGANVLLLRLADLHDDPTLVSRFVTLVEQSALANPVPHVVYICPDPIERAGGPAPLARNFMARLRQLPSVSVVPADTLDAIYPVAAKYDPTLHGLADIPYTGEFFAALATHIVRTIVGSTRRPVKVLAVDCDHTLWDGICGEQAPADLTLAPGHRALQEFLVERQQEGALICLCSKNNADDVADVFRRRADFPLTMEHVVASRINWDRKSTNILALCRDLDVAPDSVAFIDDDPRECAEVRANCADVMVLPLPERPDDYRPFLEHCWGLDAAFATDEGRRRTALYRDETRRKAARAQAADMDAYLADLDIRVTVQPITSESAVRASELSYRTTQFNTSGLRRSAADLVAQLEAGAFDGFVVDVRDRYGNYGTVGVVLHRAASNVLTVPLFALSCRALARGVEEQIVAELVRTADASQCREIAIDFTSTPRNAPAREFFQRIGARVEPRDGDGAGVFRLSLPFTMPSRAGGDRPILAASAPERESGPARAELFDVASDRWLRIANELREPAAILARVRASTQQIRASASPAAGPASPTEAVVAEIWADLLNVDRVDRLDDFVALGGDSLKAIQILARLREYFGIDVPVDVLSADSVTVALIAACVDERLRADGVDVAHVE